jgi:hypothetical protein
MTDFVAGAKDLFHFAEIRENDLGLGDSRPHRDFFNELSRL